MAHGYERVLGHRCVQGTIALEQEKAFREATTVFLGAVLSVIGDKLVDAYLHVHVAKDLWDALESKFGAVQGARCML